jgi:predicted phosphoribosyltransferase
MHKKTKTFAILACLIVGGSALYAAVNVSLSKLQLKFKDRIAAGNILAFMLQGIIKTETINNRKRENVLVLGIPRGGVLTADIVARKLSVGFDIVIARKLGDPENKEEAIGAVAEDGTVYIDQKLVNSLQISQEYIEKEKSQQMKQIKDKAHIYHTVIRESKIEGKIIILVDDGAATGSTIIAAARWIKKREPKRLIVAVPVAPRQTVESLKKEADHIQVITSPSSSSFRSIGQFYQNFYPITDEQVISIIRNRNLSPH